MLKFYMPLLSESRITRIGGLHGFFCMYPVCLALISFTPALNGSKIRDPTNLHFDKKLKLRFEQNAGFPARSFCTLQGGVAG